MSGETGTEVRREEALQCVERQGQRCGEQARGRSRVASRARDMSRQHASNRHATAHDMSLTDARGVPPPPRALGQARTRACGSRGTSVSGERCVGRRDTSVKTREERQAQERRAEIEERMLCNCACACTLMHARPRTTDNDTDA